MPAVANRSQGGIPPLATPLLLTLVGLALLYWTWGKWNDLVIDYGRELYVPWQIVEGKALYRDLAWFNGPLSPWLNALWFRLFGTGYWTLVWCNLAILVGMVAMIHHLVRRQTDRATALVCSLLFLLMFAMPRLHEYGNYTYVCPYSHGATHGLALALLMLVLLGRAWRRPHPLPLVGAGLCLGLVLLTKPEIFAAALAALVTVMVLGALADGESRRRTPVRAALLAGAALLPPLAAWLLLCQTLPAGRALTGVLGAWPQVLAGTVTELKFYRDNMGLSDPGASLAGLAVWTGMTLVALVLPAWLAALLGRRLASRPGALRLLTLLLIPITAAGLGLATTGVDWGNGARPLPALLVVLTGWSLVGVLAGRGKEGSDPARGVMACALTVFALAMLLKMVLNPTFRHYGFTLAMPATLVVAAALVHRLPRLLARRGGQPGPARAVVLAALGVLAVNQVLISDRYYALKRVTVSAGPDWCVANGRGEVLNRFMGYLKPRLEPGQTLLVLPEGIMANYLLRTPAPTGHINFMPPELLIFGEERILAELEASPPDWVALWHRPTPEYGFPRLGEGYGEKIRGWLESNYRKFDLIRHPDPWIRGKPGGWLWVWRPKR